MDIKLFTAMLNDKCFPDYQSMKYKYSEAFSDFIQTIEDLYYINLPILDAGSDNLVYMGNIAGINQNSVKVLLQAQKLRYGIKAVEDEIVASSAIESIDFSRDSVRRILKGMAPKDEQENRIYGIKQGYDFIADINNEITEENIYLLYQMTVGDFLPEDEKLKGKNKYRHDSVYVVSDRVEHAGLNYRIIAGYMKTLVQFIHQQDEINDLVKAAIIHFYVAYLHPYFDGNGRMARLLHLWFLVQKGYQSVLFIPFSSKIEKNRGAYYQAFSLIEKNKNYSGKIDVTPFILYFVNYVYKEIGKETKAFDTLALYQNALGAGRVTEKETKLWQFVLSFYGTGEFSTKQLEKDFGNAAYATIRCFVLKFEEIGLLSSVKYGTRVKYKVRTE